MATKFAIKVSPKVMGTMSKIVTHWTLGNAAYEDNDVFCDIEYTSDHTRDPSEVTCVECLEVGIKHIGRDLNAAVKNLTGIYAP
jgi:hypothetical protein